MVDTLSLLYLPTALMIPCPASITVMLLALSVGQAAFGIVAVLCFSLGLAVTMPASA